jgi:hypothetical protein
VKLVHLVGFIINKSRVFIFVRGGCGGAELQKAAYRTL